MTEANALYSMCLCSKWKNNYVFFFYTDVQPSDSGNLQDVNLKPTLSLASVEGITKMISVLLTIFKEYMSGLFLVYE